MLFINVGSGSKGNCSFVIKNNTVLMIDAGIGIRRVRKVMQDYNIDHIDAILVTHRHSDHISNLSKFKDIPVYANDKTIENSNYIDCYKEYIFNDFKVYGLPLSHDVDHTVGYYIKDNNDSLTYITDTGYINSNVIDYCYDSKYIVMECNHDVQMLLDTKRPYVLKSRILGDEGHLNNIDGANNALKISGSNTKQVMIAHVSKEANTYQLAYDTVKEIFKDKKDIEIICLKQDEITIGGSYE